MGKYKRPLARSPSVSAQEHVLRDGRPVPEVFTVESPCFLGNEDIPFFRYTDQKFFDSEMEKMWSRTWQWACREEHIPEVGDYYVYEVGPLSVFIVRNSDSSIRGYVNSCLHRGTKFKAASSEGSCSEIRCPFHGWSWDLSGNLKNVPYDWDAPHVGEHEFKLPEVQVDTWGGFVFVNFDMDAAGLTGYLDPLPVHFENFSLADRFIELHVEKELDCNWKAAVEAFIENYHTQQTHPQLLMGSDDEGTQYDVFTDHVSRFFCAFGVASPSVDPKPTDQELLDMTLVGDRSLLGDDLKVKAGESARMAMARVLRKSLGETYRCDLTKYTDTEMIDVSQYGLFPNMILFPQLSLPMIYRFRPIGLDPSKTLFELIVLRPIPDEGKRPLPARPFRLGPNDSFTQVPGFDENLGVVYDQDTGNLRLQQEGLAAARKEGATLLNYQEVRVRLLHQTLDRYLQDK